MPKSGWDEFFEGIPLIGGMLSGMKKIAEDLLPTVIQEVDAVVYGDPKASRKELYQVALAAALGHLQVTTTINTILPTGMIMLEYNSDQNYVRVYIKQRIKVTYALLSAAYAPMSTLSYFNSLQIFDGPKEELKGGKWNWYAGLELGGVPAKLTNNLKYTDYTILTKNPTYTSSAGAFGFTTQVSHNPRPRQDNISRASLPIASQTDVIDAVEPGLNPYNRPDYILFQALSEPCNAQENLNYFIPPTGTANPPTATIELNTPNNPPLHIPEAPSSTYPRRPPLTQELGTAP